MSTVGITSITITRGDATFHVYGENAGAEGVWLAKGQVEGLYDAPVSTTFKAGAFQTGSTAKAVKWLHRDMELGFHIIDTTDSRGLENSYEINESAFRQIFFYELDKWEVNPEPTVINVRTELSGLRHIDVLMYEEPEFNPDVDPIRNQHGNLILKLRAPNPMWYSTDRVTKFTSDATASAGTVSVNNPTDQVMYQRWVITSAKNSGDINWTLPDYSWQGSPGAREVAGLYSERLLNDIVITQENDGCIIDLDRQQLMYRDGNDTNILGQMGGQKIFTQPIPPWTPYTYLPVSYKGADGGGDCQLIQPRRWSRPWGMEALSVRDTASPKDYTFHVSEPGANFEFQIPPWAERMDIVVLGGGGGGEGGNIGITGSGGSGAIYVARTVIRGVDIPWDTATLNGVCGKGGRGGVGVDWVWTYDAPAFHRGGIFSDIAGGVDGEPGTSTYVNGTGMATVESVGGAGGKHQMTMAGGGVDELVFNGYDYPGARSVGQIPSAEWIGPLKGRWPGGGAPGGWPFYGPAGQGAAGGVWIRAYGWSGS